MAIDACEMLASLGATLPAGAALHAGLCTQHQAPCWHHRQPTAALVHGTSCGLWCTLEPLQHFTPESSAVPVPSSCRSVSNPSGTMWEEICFLNVSHYQLMGMLANERAQRHGGGRARADGRALLLWGLAAGSPETATSSRNDYWKW